MDFGALSEEQQAQVREINLQTGESYQVIAARLLGGQKTLEVFNCGESD